VEANRDEDKKKEDSIFVSSGKLHISHPIWKLATVLLAVPIGSIAIGGIISYRSFISEIGGVVRSEIKEVPYNKDYTIFEKIGELDNYKKSSDKDINQLYKDTDDIFCFLNKGKNCRTRQR